MRKIIALTMASWAALAQAQAPQTIHSPDGRVTLNVALGSDGTLTYGVDYAGTPVIAPSPVGITLTTDHPDQPTAGRVMSGLRILSSDRREGRDTYVPVHGKTSQVDDAYSELTLHAQESGGQQRRIDLILRAYDSGAAF